MSINRLELKASTARPARMATIPSRYAYPCDLMPTPWARQRCGSLGGLPSTDHWWCDADDYQRSTKWSDSDRLSCWSPTTLVRPVRRDWHPSPVC